MRNVSGCADLSLDVTLSLFFTVSGTLRAVASSRAAGEVGWLPPPDPLFCCLRLPQEMLMSLPFLTSSHVSPQEKLSSRGIYVYLTSPVPWGPLSGRVLVHVCSHQPQEGAGAGGRLRLLPGHLRIGLGNFSLFQFLFSLFFSPLLCRRGGQFPLRTSWRFNDVPSGFSPRLPVFGEPMLRGGALLCSS